jgi:hypothetical protein
MKLLLLKILLQRRARDEGFTLPIVIGLGLVMILLGAISITTANEENITAITQNSKSDALAIAEVGVARYRETLDRNRRLAINDSSQWGALTGICNNNTNETTTTADDYFPSLTVNAPNTIALGEDGQILNNDGDNTDSFNIGSYSLVSYDYSNANDTFNSTNDATNNNARGILTVKGRAPDGSEAQIEAEIPVRINLEEMNTIAPALWIGNNSITSLGNLTINNGNVVIKDPATATGDGCRNFADTDTTDGSQNLAASTVTFATPPTTTPPTPQGSVISESRDLPPITQIITDIASARTGLSIATGNPINSPPSVTLASPPPVTTPPTPPGADRMIFGSTVDEAYNPNAVSPDSPTDCSHTKIKLCRYYYDLGTDTSSLTSPLVDTDLLTDGIARTTLLLNQSLTINASSKNVKIGSTSPVANDSDTFEIYVNGSTNNITINADTGRTVTINGFIHAPQSTLTITGSGTVNINGSVWVNNFVNSTATVNISPDIITRVPTADDSSTSGRGYRFYSTTASRTARPITGSPTNWKTEQVTP